jgi:hypothetical protein
MRKNRVWITLVACFVAAAIFAWAQGIKKAGLWEVTTTQTWQKSPFPPGMQLPPQAAAMFGGAPHTTQVCYSQEWVNRFGGPLPPNRECQATNISTTPSGMSADWVCNGRMIGKGTVQASWPDSEHATGKVHFAGVMQAGQGQMPIEFTVDYSSVYKGADCGSVQPLPLPPESK